MGCLMQTGNVFIDNTFHDMFLWTNVASNPYMDLFYPTVTNSFCPVGLLFELTKTQHLFISSNDCFGETELCTE